MLCFGFLTFFFHSNPTQQSPTVVIDIDPSVLSSIANRTPPIPLETTTKSEQATTQEFTKKSPPTTIITHSTIMPPKRNISRLRSDDGDDAMDDADIFADLPTQALESHYQLPRRVLSDDDEIVYFAMLAVFHATGQFLGIVNAFKLGRTCHAAGRFGIKFPWADSQPYYWKWVVVDGWWCASREISEALESYCLHEAKFGGQDFVALALSPLRSLIPWGESSGFVNYISLTESFCPKIAAERVDYTSIMANLELATMVKCFVSCKFSRKLTRAEVLSIHRG